MNRWIEMYKDRCTGADDIAGRIPSGSVCVSPCLAGEPPDILSAIADRAVTGGVENIQHHQLLPFRDHRYLQPEMAESIRHVSWFTSGYSRKAVQEGRADFMPVFYHEVPRFWREFLEPDVFCALVSPMDAHGYFSFGLSCSEARAAVERADLVFLEVNPNMPRTHGHNFIHISEVHGLCESELPIVELPSGEPGETDEVISGMITELIPDGATIQLGIGAIPNAIGRNLRQKKDLGIHSEMFTEAFIDLIECGAVTNVRKKLNPGKSVTTFAAGSRRMYDYLNDNPGIEFKPVDYVNSPDIIGMHDDFTSVNSCLEVDLLGQVCSESLGHRNFSGTGGQVDFVRGAARSSGGKSFIAMYSTAKNGTLSKIRPILTPGSVVTTSKNDVDYIVTEFGVARLKGKTAGQRAKALIGLAHPEFRAELTREAQKMNLIV
jgi:4-hydroxybutyrate CoA-transferase